MENYTGKKVSTFRERFTELCEADSKNATAMANALHVSKQTISAWKSGTRSPKDLTIVAISEYFNVSIPWLMGFDEPKMRKSLDDPLTYNGKKLSKADEETLDRLLDFIVSCAKTNRKKAKNILLALMEGE